MNMEKKYSRKYIGKEYQTNECYTVKVIDGGSKYGYCTVQIKDYVNEVAISSIKKGNVKYPYHLSVFGVGYIGEGEYRARVKGKKTKAYRLWSSMLTRCYYKKLHKENPTYKDCYVSDEWLNFQVFAKWFEKSHKENWELDKDLLIKNNKVYSQDTCIFIPRCLNAFLANIYSSNTSGHAGVCWYKKYNKWLARIRDCDTHKRKNLGYHITKEEASIAYQRARTTMAHRMKQKMILEYGITDLRILDAIDKL